MKLNSENLFSILLITLVSIATFGDAFPISAPGTLAGISTVNPKRINVFTGSPVEPSDTNPPPYSISPGPFGKPDLSPNNPPRSRVPDREEMNPFAGERYPRDKNNSPLPIYVDTGLPVNPELVDPKKRLRYYK
ncbi:hypothetical protein K457DRAFT_25812 [Linnemannia elongata AG-77]|uniref:Uncharacterized protein n=1 Tax=Linnemannia elongata AG-77 TaxID=1314771 RepID=A0A197JE00_9FUNG|nr:hypothetical protein K457DRAFT_25812 [Linnemannia elongata AG-77]